MIKLLIGDKLIIEPIKENIKESEGGLLLAEKHREDIRCRTAKVIKKGTNVLYVNEGDEIFYDRFAGFALEINDVIHTVIKESDVIAIL